MRSNSTAAALAAATLLLTACGSEQEEQAPAETGDSRTAKGEVLGGTISDEMLPLDTLRSQSPPLAGEDTPDAPGSSDDEQTGDGEEGEPPAE